MTLSLIALMDIETEHCNVTYLAGVKEKLKRSYENLACVMHQLTRFGEHAT